MWGRVRRVFFATILFMLTLASSVQAEDSDSPIISFGLGMTINPVLFLISPQVEWEIWEDCQFGLLLQGAVSGTRFISSVSGTTKWFLGGQNTRPFFEVGLGLANSATFVSSVLGVLFHFGFGLDIVASDSFSLGTGFRLNIPPPIKDIFVSWPILTTRFRF